MAGAVARTPSSKAAAGAPPALLRAPNAGPVASKPGARKAVRTSFHPRTILEVRGVGPEYAELLRRAGVGSVADLAEWEGGETACAAA